MQATDFSGEGPVKAPAISVLGDSISTFEGCIAPGNRVYYQSPQTERTGVLSPDQTWWMQVIGALGGRLCANGSFSGSMVQGKAFPAGEAAGRAEQLRGEDGEEPDVVLFFIGINDYGWGTPEAQEAGRSEASPAVVAARAAGWSEAAGPLPDADLVPEGVPGAAPADAAERFGAAYRAMLERVQAVAPGAQLWCITVPPGRETANAQSAFTYALRGVPFDDYNQAIRDAAATAGARVADVAALGFDYDAVDGTHPTALGMQQFAAMVLRAMAAELESVPAAEHRFAIPEPLPPLPPDAMRSQRLCDAPTCIGCPHARATGNPWLCVCDKPLSS